MNTLEEVAKFHRAFGHPINDAPTLADQDVNRLRLDLLHEELVELREALAKGDHVAALDALTDLQYVLDGAYLALGLHRYKDAAFAEVQRSNMSKLRADGTPMKRPDGKILKGPHYSPPDLMAVILRVNGVEPCA